MITYLLFSRLDFLYRSRIGKKVKHVRVHHHHEHYIDTYSYMRV